MSAILQSLTVMLICLRGVIAPFPIENKFNQFNPYIEPWWHSLTKDTQDSVYKAFEVIEPTASAQVDYSDAQERREVADGRAWRAGQHLLSSTISELKQTLLGHELRPEFTNILDVDEEDLRKGKFKTETRYSSPTHTDWENFQLAFQHAMYLRMVERRAQYQTFLEKLRLQAKFVDGAKRKLKNLKKNVEADFLEKKMTLEGLKDKLLQSIEAKKSELTNDGLKGLFGGHSSSASTTYAVPENHP